MQSPFWENLRHELRRLKGRNLTFGIIFWVLLLIVGLTCALGAFSPPEREAIDVAPTERQPTATLPVESIVLPTPTPLPEGAEPTPGMNLPSLPWGEFGYGIALQGVVPVAGDYSYSMRQVRDHLGLGWVKQQVRWEDVHPERDGELRWYLYDPVVDAAHELGLKVMLSIVDAPRWTRSYLPENVLAAPPDDLTLYADFLGDVVERYEGKIHAIEVWNEQNLNREWDTAEGLSAQRYVEMLRLSYQAIKSRDPGIVVITGALSPTGVTGTDPNNPNRYLYMDDYLYLQQMIDADLLDYADCVGVHHNGINLPPNVSWNEGYDDPTAQFRGPFPDGNPHHSWSFKSTLWDYYAMIQEAGYNTPLCVTEFGWASAEGWSAVAEGFEFAWDNTLEEQAEWVVEAFQLMRQWGFVRLAFLWNLDYGQKGGVGETDPNAPYSIINFDGSPRPAFDAVGRMPKYP